MEADPYRPTPSYLYRHRLYRRLLAGMEAAPVLEVGAGRGEMAAWLGGRGAAGVALEPSPRAAAFAARALAPFPSVEVVEEDFARFETAERFALVLMLEILEHVEDDRGFVRKAAALLRPGGRLVLSVPAHGRQWGWRDDAKGHLRRFERAELAAMLGAAALEPRLIWCWGWPLLSFLRWTDRRKKAAAGDRAEATALSAVTADVKAGPRWFLSPAATALPFAFMDLFLRGDRGVGYIVAAQKS